MISEAVNVARRIIIVGAGTHGRAVAEAVSLLPDFELIGFLDDGALQSDTVFDLPVLGGVDFLPRLSRSVDGVVVAIGSNRVRERIHERVLQLKIEVQTIVHPRAFVSPSALLGPGCMVMAGAQVGTEARLGRGVLVNTNAVVDHHCVVEDFAHVGTAAAMAGCAFLGARAWMQAGSAIGYGVRVAADEVLDVGEARQAG